MDEPDNQQSVPKDMLTKIKSSPVKSNRIKTGEVICIEDSPVKIKPESPQKPAEPEVYTRIIGGVSITFPVKPYGAQIAVMDKVSFVHDYDERLFVLTFADYLGHKRHHKKSKLSVGESDGLRKDFGVTLFGVGLAEEAERYLQFVLFYTSYGFILSCMSCMCLQCFYLLLLYSILHIFRFL